ncbi:CDP-alcohol phosphatidyltransferase family protein [Pseudokineococcus marinus]|uniref:CDP-alcohol phosphatidyltransferase family protein n=1 Tax=Pseudokineococcus marinus TaxID=351215 RepID=UPI001BB2DF03|nr:CDP-alcohol phosphatidyltransferase family protein [Pseudokineococcus marinus]
MPVADVPAARPGRRPGPVGGAGEVRRCGVRGCSCADPRLLASAPNAVTLARTALSLGLVAAAAAERSWPLLLAAYLAYWVGDVADGALARHLRQETRLGAVLDVVCDRLNCTSCALTLLLFVPAPAPVTVFLVQFVLVDLVLSLLPLRWPVLSPNYFGLVDPLVHAANWHPLAKAANTGLLVVLLVAVPDHRVALAAAAVVLVAKAASLVRVLRLPRPSSAHVVPVDVDPARASRA